MNTAVEGDRVKLNYTLRLQNGAQFVTTKDGEPIEFKIGRREVLRALEHAVIGMTVGDTKTLTVPAEQAFGPRKQELVVTVKRSCFVDCAPQIGARYRLLVNGDRHLQGVVLWADDDTVTLDANHPLAGKTLTIDIELLEIVQPS